MKLQHTWSPSNHSDGKVPWLQIGDRTRTKKPYPERYGAIGDSSAVEETFQPHLTSTPTARVRTRPSSGHRLARDHRLQWQCSLAAATRTIAALLRPPARSP